MKIVSEVLGQMTESESLSLPSLPQRKFLQVFAGVALHDIDRAGQGELSQFESLLCFE